MSGPQKPPVDPQAESFRLYRVGGLTPINEPLPGSNEVGTGHDPQLTRNGLPAETNFLGELRRLPDAEGDQRYELPARRIGQ